MGSIRVCYYTAILLLGSKCFVRAENNSTYENVQYLNYQDEYNHTRVINLKESPDYSLLNKLSPFANKYFLYTRSNPTTSQLLIFNDNSSINSSYFNPLDQTIVIVHGWFGNRHSTINPTIRDAFLDKMKANIIVVDWSLLASSNYMTTSLGVPRVGTGLGQFLAFLNKDADAPYSLMHLVGFSLGAHVVGNAGSYLNGDVARITGLDPAGPLWNPLNSKRLTAADALYVEAIHTNRDMLGTAFRSGDVDFYPNGGNSQPGCLSISYCSHSRSWQLFAATVTLDHLVGRKCRSEISMALKSCYGDYLHMGNGDLFKKGSGQYVLKTDSKYPYTQQN